MFQENQPKVITFACKAVNHLCRGPLELVNALINAGFCAHLVDIIKNEKKSFTLISFAIEALANMTYKIEDVSDKLVDLKLLPLLYEVLDSEGYCYQDMEGECFDSINMTLEDICTLLANIISINAKFLQIYIDEKLIEALVGIMSRAELRVQQFAAEIFMNISSATPDQILYLINCGFVAPL